jgi:hypothetical protein
MMENEAEMEESSEDDTPDVVVEDEEVRIKNVRGAGSGAYIRSPRPQSPQNPKKAKQENKNGKNDSTVDNSQKKFDGATMGGSGIGVVRQRYPSGNKQQPKNQNSNNTRQPMNQPLYPVQKPGFQQFRAEPPAAAAYSSGGQPFGQRVGGRPKRGRRLRPVVIDGSNVAVT